MCSQQWLQQQLLHRWHELCVIELVGAGLLLLPNIWVAVQLQVAVMPIGTS
jgi:hypothetical protein